MFEPFVPCGRSHPVPHQTRGDAFPSGNRYCGGPAYGASAERGFPSRVPKCGTFTSRQSPYGGPRSTQTPFGHSMGSPPFAGGHGHGHSLFDSFGRHGSRNTRHWHPGLSSFPHSVPMGGYRTMPMNFAETLFGSQPRRPSFRSHTYSQTQMPGRFPPPLFSDDAFGRPVNSAYHAPWTSRTTGRTAYGSGRHPLFSLLDDLDDALIYDSDDEEEYEDDLEDWQDWFY